MDEETTKTVDIKRYSKSLQVQTLLKSALQSCDLLKNVPEPVVDKMIETMESREFDISQVRDQTLLNGQLSRLS